MDPSDPSNMDASSQGNVTDSNRGGKMEESKHVDPDSFVRRTRDQHTFHIPRE